MLQLPTEPFALKELVNYQSGAVVSKEILKTAHGTVTLFAFDEGQGLSEHTAPFDVLVSIVDGEAEITISGKMREIKAGEIIRMPANEPHAINAGKKFMMLLIMLKG